MVQDNFDHFCKNIEDLFGFDPDEEVTKLIDTNWLAVTSVLMKLQSQTTARNKLGLNTLILVYYAGHAVTAEDNLYMVFNTENKAEQYLPLEDKLVGISNQSVVLGIFDTPRFETKDRSIPQKIN